jgi:hypothetical protein
MFFQADSIADLENTLRRHLSSSASAMSLQASHHEHSAIAASRMLEETSEQVGELRMRNRELLEQKEALGEGLRLQQQKTQAEISLLRQERDALQRELEEARAGEGEARAKEQREHRELAQLRGEVSQLEKELEKEREAGQGGREAVEVLRMVEGQLRASAEARGELKVEVEGLRRDKAAYEEREKGSAAALEAALARAAAAERGAGALQRSIDERKGEWEGIETQRDALLEERGMLLKRLDAAEASMAAAHANLLDAQRKATAAADSEARSRQECASAREAQKRSEERARAEMQTHLALKEQVMNLKMRLVDEARRAERAERAVQDMGGILDVSTEA